jgi:HEPN domain-containing protein
VKYKITLQTNTPQVSERSLLDERNFGRFLFAAEEDYLLARCLLSMSIYESGMYHYQQCMEKYFKAFLIQNKVDFRNTHDLDKLRAMCLSNDKYFSDPDLIEACKKVNPFEEVGRYPSSLLRSYGWLLPDIIFFLDEFAYKMRQRINHNGVSDLIGEMQSSGKATILDYDDSSKFLTNLFFKDNEFFKR